jgi:O-antigen/teichoic acid export membrane protein
MTTPNPGSDDPTTTPRPQHALRHDVGTAFRNALQLGTSLVATWSVALFVRFFLPRHLGPERFGLYGFADSLAAAIMGLISFGVDSYIQKEIPVRPQHASDFFGGVVVLRSLLAGLAIGVIVAILHLTGRTPQALETVAIFGFGYTLYNLNGTLAALLQANTTVSGLALTNPVTKLIWGASVGAGLALGAPLPVLAAAFGLSEALRALILMRIVRRQLDLKLHVDLRAAWAVIVISLPYYLNALVLTVNARLDITTLGFVVHDDTIVGYYAAAANLAGLSLMMVPLMFSVLMPLMTRSFRRSPDEFWAVVRRAIAGLLTVAMPVTLFLALGAELWIRVVFGRAFGQSAVALRALAPQFVFTYVAMLLSMSLIVTGRAWTLTRISVTGLLLNPVLTVALIKICQAWAGPSAAVAGAALGAVSTEVIVTIQLLSALRASALDRQNVPLFLRTLLVCGAVTALFFMLAPLGHLRLVVCVVAYAALATLLGAVRPREVIGFGREVWRARA